MKKIFVSLVCATIFFQPVMVQASEKSNKFLLIAVAALAGYAVTQAHENAQYKGYLTHDGKKHPVQDPYKDTGNRHLGNEHELTWTSSADPVAVCNAAHKTGAYFSNDGCSTWVNLGEERRCTIVTYNKTSNQTIGRLFVACKNGG